MFDPTLCAIVAFCAVVCLWDHADQKRHIRDLLNANDKMWNELIIKHQKSIVEAYEQGKPFQINIERR